MTLFTNSNCRLLLILVASGVCTFAGCQRAPNPDYVLSEKTLSLDSEFQTGIKKALVKFNGTPASPLLLNETYDEERAKKISFDDKEYLKLGAAVYRKRCVQCHGYSGDGNGPVGKYMYPKPRDYRRGMFKFTSTGYGEKPRRDDLKLTLQRGIPGTSMPAFSLLPDKELDAVLDYVLVLTHRGELENALAYEVEIEEELDEEYVPELAEEIVDLWKDAELAPITPLTPLPEFSEETVAAGKTAFLSKGCSKCHGDDGRGQTEDNLKAGLKDNWGNPTRAADLTSGMLRGGQRPIDIYRHIYSGINGTPMPSFATALAEEPDTIWDLVSYVLYLSSRRRVGDIPAAGYVVPHVAAGAESSAEESDESSDDAEE